MPQSIVQYDKELPYIEGRNPWEVPTSFLKKKKENEYELVQGRRPSKMLLVNKLRSEIDKWRNDGYPGATATSQELLVYWFDQAHPPVFGNEPFHFYFCQREAIETIIYLFEIKKFTDVLPLIKKYHEKFTGNLFSSNIEFSKDLDGVRKVKRYFPELDQEGEQELPEEDLLRYAIKMATGSGKTFVMAFVVVWSYFNRLREKDRRYANNFLLVAPNVIVYERLAKDFANGKIFEELPFVPTAWKSKWKLNIKLRGDESPLAAENNFVLNNIHQLYESRIKEFNPNNIIEAILGRKPQSDPGKSPQTLLERMKELDNLLVMNDEAHHVHDDELKWNESLLSIHNHIPGGFKMWLDFSATPKTPENTYYPWIICDYPLAQAVEDRIVKVPLIVHTVNKKDPEHITGDNVVQKYGDWISAALGRWKEHYEAFKEVKKKPVLFIMAEKNAFADKIAAAIERRGSTYGIEKDEIMTIHTDNTGEVRKRDLESLREEARDVDNPKNNIKVIVSVLMLREGWDVQNVTIVLGLRAFDSAILPEQAIGRGLRLMRDISPDRTQTLEVIGNEKFEKIVKMLELEGVGVNTTKTPPPLPVTISPEKKRLQYDIEIPATDFSYNRAYKNLSGIDAKKFPLLFTSEKLDENRKVLLKMEMMQLGVEVHQTEVDIEYIELGRDLTSYITQHVMKRAGLTDCFQFLYPICEDYILNKCFEVKIDEIEKDELRKILRELSIQEAIIDLLAKEIGKATVEKKQVKVQGKSIKLSETPKFTWRRGHIKLKKTVFNFVATYNDFEKEFAEFLDKANDVEAFAALADIFRIDYLSNTGAIRYYFPDFVAVQTIGKKKVYWILETKGREYPDLDNKNKAIERWCKAVTKQTGVEWKYLLVKQHLFNTDKKATVTLKQLEDKVNGQTTIL
ncbi:MAG: DEAD/DEAH box helicase family protein [Chitinophagales bacterium]|nr:DEAD/DEAH box helicase family protein [Chitinophagales bacterium]